MYLCCKIRGNRENCSPFSAKVATTRLVAYAECSSSRIQAGVNREISRTLRSRIIALSLKVGSVMVSGFFLAILGI